jgi:hypothetical protein
VTEAGERDLVIAGNVKTGFLFALFFKFSDVEDLDDIGVAHGGEYVALLVEELKRGRIGDV